MAASPVGVLAARAFAPAVPIRAPRAPVGRLGLLVLDAQYRQALATLRSLSRAGVRVGAVACRSELEGALALNSQFCQWAAVVPDFAQDASGYAKAILDLLDASRAEVVLPCHDGSIQTLREIRDVIELRAAFPLASEAALDIAVSKVRTLEVARSLGIAVPRSALVTSASEIPSAVAELGLPLVLKPVQSWITYGGVGQRLSCELVDSSEAAVKAFDVYRCPVMLQQWLPGRRDAVTVFAADGRIWATFVQTSYRELPPLGGASVLCESLPPLPDLVEPALRLVQEIELDGCSMVEFRRDAAGKPVLMEINARLPGSIGLAMNCGIDFPDLLYRWALGRPLKRCADYGVGKRMRWLSGDIWNLKTVLGAAGEPGTQGRTRAVARFLLDFLQPSSALDIVDPDDTLPARLEFRQMFLKPAVRRIRRTLFGASATRRP